MGRAPILNVEVVRSAAADGLSMAEIAERLGCDYQLVRLCVRRHEIPVRSAKRGPGETGAAQERAQRMLTMHKQGVSMEKIGRQFSLTRERVRQILKKLGTTGKSGGPSIGAALKREHKDRIYRAKVMAKYGLPPEVVRELQKARITHAYGSQRSHAHMRGIGWELDFATWFAVWQTSGKLHLRGRGKGKYSMSRIKDDGPYAVGNVHIQLAADNSREAVDKWRGKVKEHRGVFCLYPGRAKAWMATVSGKSIGYFETEAEAVEARSAELVRRGKKPAGLGGGRGWTYDARCKNRPYTMQCTGVKTQRFATQAEAEAAYGAAVAQRMAAFQQVSEPTKSGGVCGFEHTSIEKNFAIFEMATDGNGGCHLPARGET